MASLSPASAAAIARLRSYVPPPTQWYSLPLSRRAAVLIVLFADRKGDLRVVLTMRAATLRNYAGQAALPGGKADTLVETPAEIARREANEEIGLPPAAQSSSFPSMSSSTTTIADETKYTPDTPTLPYPFRLEHLCQLPTHLAKTELGVRPCVAWLYATAPTDRQGRRVGVENTLMPRLDAKEVAAVFSAPFHNFLRSEDEAPGTSGGDAPMPPSPVPGKWYEGSWINWHEGKWRMHNFYVPVQGRSVTWAKTSEKQTDESEKGGNEEREGDSTAALQTHHLHTSSTPTSATSPPSYPAPSTTLPYRDLPSPTATNPLTHLPRFRVFGMTARILVDCARVAYAEEPTFPHNGHFGDEAVIARLLEVGRLADERGRGAEFEGADLRRALDVGKAKGDEGVRGRL